MEPTTARDRAAFEVFAGFGLSDGPDAFPPFDLVPNWVLADLLAGFLIEDEGGGFVSAFRPSNPESPLESLRIAEFFGDDLERTFVAGRLAVVPWEFDCVQAASFQSLPITGRSITMQGTTFIVQAGRAQARRYINWMDIVANLGIGVAYRGFKVAEETN